MHSRVLGTILLINILDEVCYAERLLGCKKFSELGKYSSVDKQELVIIINFSITDDVYFIPQYDSYEITYLLLDSCEKGAKALKVINKTELLEKIHKYREQTTNTITIDFESLKNSCTPIADIKAKLQKKIYSKDTIPTLYVDASEEKVTSRKAIKRLEKDKFMLLDDCKLNNGELMNLTAVSNLIQKLAKGVREAVKIEFPGPNFYESYLDIATEISNDLKNKYKNNTKVQALAEPTTTAIPPANGTFLIYKYGIFCQATTRTDLIQRILFTATNKKVS